MNSKNQQEGLGKRWYVMRAIGGKEGKVEKHINLMLKNDTNFAKHVFRVLVLKEKTTVARNGKLIPKEKNRYPGYVFVEAELTSTIQELLRNVPNILGFLSYSKVGNKPMPLSSREVAQLLGSVDDLQETKCAIIPFKVGESVEVTDGPFTAFKAVVEEVNSNKNTLKLSVKIFGRKTPLEMGFSQVKRLS